MNHFTRRAGTRCLRWLVLPGFFAALSLPAPAQEAPSTAERTLFDRYRSGTKTEYGPESKAVFDKYARYYAAQFSNPDTQRPGADKGMSWWIGDLDKRLHVPQHNTPGEGVYYSRLKAEQKQFVDEFGKSLVEALAAPATQAGNPIIRINAARMVAEVCRSGYDGAAEVCLKILAKPDENDAVKFYALQGLKNLFAIIPEPDIREKTVFQKDNTGALPPLEQKCIQALMDFVFRQPPAETTGDTQGPSAAPPDVDAMLYVRREAVRALALVRVQQVKNKNVVVSRPALALLRIAAGDGVNPPSINPNGPDVRAVLERIEAVVGFCNLTAPKSDRDMNYDVAMYHIGRAFQDMAALYQPTNNVTSTPWKTSVMRLRDALTNLQAQTYLPAGDRQLIKDLFDAVDRDVLQPIEKAEAANMPNPAAFGEWVKQHVAKSETLFKSDPKSTIGVKK